MDVGTVDIIEDPIETPRKRSGGLGGTNPPGGGRDPGGGGENNDPDFKDDKAAEAQSFKPGISRLFTAFLLLAVMMTFGGLIAAYMVIATNNVAEWRPFDLPIQVWISTAIIAISGITYEFARRAVDRNDQPSARKWLIATTALGAAFISSQILAWLALSARGLYVRGNPYAGFFYILTAVHAVHVAGGITALGTLLLRNWYPTRRDDELERRRTMAQVVGWYWHFMGGLWIVLFLLLGFWK